MTNNAVAECGVLIRIEVVAHQLATGHTTDRVDEITTEKIFEPVLIRVMSVGTTVEVCRRRIFPTLLVMSVLRTFSTCATTSSTGTYSITFLVKHERSNSPPGVGAIAGLATDTDSSMAPAILILGPWNGMSGHWHDRVSGGSMEVGITEVVDGEQPANGVPYIPSRLGR